MAGREDRAGAIAFRRADSADISTLAEMRREFTYEDPEPQGEARSDYDEAFQAIVGHGIATGQWVVWLAEVHGVVVSHVFVGLIERIPRPTREPRFIGYVTNVYTRPTDRGQGIGGRLLTKVVEWASASDVELLVVWPSDESVGFYDRAGFTSGRDPLVWTRP